MVEIEFIFESTKFSFQFKTEELMEDICKKFYLKAINNKLIEKNYDINLLIFLYDGIIIDKKIILAQIMNNEDKKRKKLTILVYSTEEKYLNEIKSFIKSDQIICPKCGENALITFKNYMIKIHGCKNNHIIEDIVINKFGETQKINESKICCNICYDKTKKYSENKNFYFCGTCKKNLCPSCKNNHHKNHIIIDYEYKNYTCLEHGDTFTSYCHTCQKNICICCENNHSNNHYTISFGKIFPKKEDLTNKLNVLKNNIDKFKIEIKKIKDILDYILENIEHYYKIISNIYNNFNIKKRN